MQPELDGKAGRLVRLRVAEVACRLASDSTSSRRAADNLLRTAVCHSVKIAAESGRTRAEVALAAQRAEQLVRTISAILCDALPFSIQCVQLPIRRQKCIPE